MWNRQLFYVLIDLGLASFAVVLVLVGWLLTIAFWQQGRKSVFFVGAVVILVGTVAYRPRYQRAALETRLYEAALRNDTNSVRLALDSGASPDTDDSLSGGYPVLCLAVEHGNIEMTKLLLARGANPAYGEYGPPIKIARERKRNDLVRLLEAPPKR